MWWWMAVGLVAGGGSGGMVQVVAAQAGGYPNFVLSGVPGDCHGGWLNGEWAYVGQTKDGRGYYKRWYAAGGYWVYIYYDADCDGGVGTVGQPW